MEETDEKGRYLRQLEGEKKPCGETFEDTQRIATSGPRASRPRGAAGCLSVRTPFHSGHMGTL